MQTRKLTPEEKIQMEVPIKGRNGEERKLEMIIGRQKLKKSFQYECKWRGLDHRFNSWIPRERLIELGFTKVVQQHDDLEASREGSGSRDLSFKTCARSLPRSSASDVAQDPQTPGGRRPGRRHCRVQRAQGVERRAKGQGRHCVRPSCFTVSASPHLCTDRAALWAKPQVLCLDEPTNFLFALRLHSPPRSR